MQHVFVKLPGFKAIYVLGISEMQDSDGPGGISVHYSLIFEITSPEISSEEAEVTTESPGDSVIADLREMVTKALREEASLPIDLNSLNFEPEVIHLPALSATSTIEVVNEPDSHNEFEVSTVEPEVDKPRLEVPLTPMEKENALVTLLDPTALPDDETTAVTGGMAERNDNSPASQDITEEEEAIYVGEPELSNEGLPIITHEIETIHHDEIGELVRDYIPTSPVILELETDAPYINLSPNLISEEDLTPVEEEGEDLDVVTPTSQVLFTTAAFAEEVTITTLSGITGQPPTEAMVNVEDANTLPGEEEAGLGVPETEDVSELEVEILEPEEEVIEVSEPEEEVIEVSEPEEEVVEVSEPEEEVVEVSEPEVVEVSEPEEEVVEVSEPEEEVVEVSEPEEEVVEVSEPEEEVVEVSEPEEEVVEVSEPEEEVVEVSEPEEEVVEVSEPEEEVVEVSEPEEEVVEVSEPEEEVVEVSEPEEEVVEVSEPEEEVVEVSEPEEEVVEVSEPEEEVVEVSEPEEEVVEVSEPEEEVVEVSEPEEEVVEVSEPEEEVVEVSEPEEEVV
ncbi:titin-like [Gymnodraco acuticeps]|uniref:Titin-like n=1 Tax=Gymnodraco acuticeps TaxID=8218 RepID=A0A6P8UMX6_GYMAC|nr:titin-like [Gymnodraco acuticeps]